jgi:hypothetical protein
LEDARAGAQRLHQQGAQKQVDLGPCVQQCEHQASSIAQAVAIVRGEAADECEVLEIQPPATAELRLARRAAAGEAVAG